MTRSQLFLLLLILALGLFLRTYKIVDRMDIGPLFYYFLVPFFILTKMDPVGATIPAVLLGLATIISYYWVFSKIFNEKVGLLGALLYAILPATVSLDRWIVPTITTPLWSIWYFYAIIMVSRGRLRKNTR